MSGGHHFKYPKWVWSPAGGWWANPTNWKRNTAVYLAFVGVAAFVIGNHFESKTVITRLPQHSSSDDHHH